MSDSELEAKFNALDLKRLQRSDLQSIEECAYVLPLIDRLAADIQAQVSHAIADVQEGKGYADRHWYVDAKRAIRAAKTTRTMVQLRMGELRAVIKRENIAFSTTETINFEREFITVVKRFVPAEVFTHLVKETEKIIGRIRNHG